MKYFFFYVLLRNTFMDIRKFEIEKYFKLQDKI